MLCPLECGINIIDDKYFPDHLKVCNNKEKLFNQEYVICEYDVYHIVKSINLEKHLDDCFSKNFTEDDIFKIINRSRINEMCEMFHNPISSSNLKKLNVNKDYIRLVYGLINWNL